MDDNNDDSMSCLSNTLLLPEPKPDDDAVPLPAEKDACESDSPAPATDADDEESGWSIYFEDFMANHNNGNQNQDDFDYNNDEEVDQGQAEEQLDITSSYFSSSCHDTNNNKKKKNYFYYEGGSSSSSLVSAAAAFSSAEQHKCFINGVHVQNDKAVQPSERIKTLKKLTSFKKRKGASLVAAAGDDLEDTATSPINSPKVSYLNQYGMSMSTKDKDHISLPGILVHQTTAERRGGVVGASGDNNSSSSSELKKKGLCLVPLSMLINYNLAAGQLN